MPMARSFIRPPYENYRLLSKPDIRALYAYFMTEVAPWPIRCPCPNCPFPSTSAGACAR